MKVFKEEAQKSACLELLTWMIIKQFPVIDLWFKDLWSLPFPYWTDYGSILSFIII